MGARWSKFIGQRVSTTRGEEQASSGLSLRQRRGCRGPARQLPSSLAPATAAAAAPVLGQAPPLFRRLRASRAALQRSAMNSLRWAAASLARWAATSALTASSCRFGANDVCHNAAVRIASCACPPTQTLEPPAHTAQRSAARRTTPQRTFRASSMRLLRCWRSIMRYFFSFICGAGSQGCIVAGVGQLCGVFTRRYGGARQRCTHASQQPNKRACSPSPAAMKPAPPCSTSCSRTTKHPAQHQNKPSTHLQHLILLPLHLRPHRSLLGLQLQAQLL